jgi:diketogulonate reductase-like aldo/keto reductase
MVGAKPVPPLLYGTAWKEQETQRCVENALEAGFRGIDTANQRRHYFEAGVGAALQKIFSAGQITRQELFLQTKFTSIDGQDERLPYDAHAQLAEQVRQSFASSLEHLGTDYVDSYILHGPTSARGLTAADWEIWRAMEGLFHEGRARLLGISNVNAPQLELLCERATVKPVFVQNRCFAIKCWDKEVRAICSEHKVTYQGFSLLTANAWIFRHPRFMEIVARGGCTPAQAVFSFVRQIGMIALTGTTDPAHMREDLESLNLTLSPDDLQAIEDLAA